MNTRETQRDTTGSGAVSSEGATRDDGCCIPLAPDEFLSAIDVELPRSEGFESYWANPWVGWLWIRRAGRIYSRTLTDSLTAALAREVATCARAYFDAIDRIDARRCEAWAAAQVETGA